MSYLQICIWSSSRNHKQIERRKDYRVRGVGVHCCGIGSDEVRDGTYPPGPYRSHPALHFQVHRPLPILLRISVPVHGQFRIYTVLGEVGGAMLRCANNAARPLILRPAVRALDWTRVSLRRQYSESNGPSVAILGGGITGLSTALYLREALPSAKVTIYEGSDRVGGWIRSSAQDVDSGQVVFEHGPRTLRPTLGLLTAHLVRVSPVPGLCLFV